MDTLWRRRIHIWINPSFVSIIIFAFHVCLPLVFTSAAFSIICIQKRLKTLLESIFLKQNVMISESSRFGNFFAFLLPRRDCFFRQKCFFSRKNRKMRSTVRFAPLRCPLFAAAPEMWCCSQIVLLAQKDKKIRRTLRCDIFPQKSWGTKKLKDA